MILSIDFQETCFEILREIPFRRNTELLDEIFTALADKVEYEDCGDNLYEPFVIHDVAAILEVFESDGVGKLLYQLFKE